MEKNIEEIANKLFRSAMKQGIEIDYADCVEDAECGDWTDKEAEMAMKEFDDECDRLFEIEMKEHEERQRMTEEETCSEYFDM